MFEITFNDREKLSELMKERKVYPKSKYDFTLENRFLVYHCPLRQRMVYISFDLKTGYGSEILSLKNDEQFSIHNFQKLLPLVLYSIKYTGDKRYLMAHSQGGYMIIEYVFKIVLPEYGYRVRSEQIKLCKSIFDGFIKKKVGICEAEVGTGKTLAFLVAALAIKIAKRGEKNVGVSPITISTSNIELQRSLIEKDIPQLSKMLKDFNVIYSGINAVLRKGRDHYFCERRYNDFIASLNSHPRKNKDLIEEMNKFKLSKPFDLDKYEMRSYLKTRICVHGCNSKCEFKKACRYNRFIEISKYGFLDIQVTNHNQYLMDLKMRMSKDQGVLQKSDFVIIDEAHKLRETAQDIFGSQLAENEISGYLESVKDANKRGYEKEYRSLIRSIKMTETSLVNELKSRIGDSGDEESVDSIITLNRQEEKLISRITMQLSELSNLQKSNSDSAMYIIEKLESFENQNEFLVWISKDEYGLLSLNCTPSNIGDVLYKNVWDRGIHHVLTSGTMSDGENFNFFEKLNGLNYIPDSKKIKHCSVSPFDYKNHTRLYIPDDIPMPENDSEEYITAVAKRVVELIHATHGHTAVLFTSYKLLGNVYEIVAPQIKEYEIFLMAKNNKTAIAEFKKSKNGVLFASGSMWEGVDCIGDSLSSVIIVRLPFPIRSAIMENKKKEFANTPQFVKEYAVPEMIIKLRQGIGRLIRCETDTGLISILDSRTLNSSYSKKLENVLSKYPRVNSIEEIEDFFKKVKPEKYFED